MLAKLDRYDYEVLPSIIRIHLKSSNDASMVDILSDIERANGRLYVDGGYYIMTGNEVCTERGLNGSTWMDIHVTTAE